MPLFLSNAEADRNTESSRRRKRQRSKGEGMTDGRPAPGLSHEARQFKEIDHFGDDGPRQIAGRGQLQTRAVGCAAEQDQCCA